MRLGLHLPNFTFTDGPAYLARDLGVIARAAEDVGFNRVSVMDHLFQIPMVGPAESEMLEAYTTLGYLAAKTSRIKLLTLVTGCVYRSPGLLAKAVTTLDVLSGGRAMLGIGAAWNKEEAEGLGLFFPPTAERFERLEETLQICRQMFDGVEAPYQAKHYRLARTLNSPRPLSSRLPILVGGSGERKTLRLVAQYADACNLFAGPDVAHKLDVLREHCDAVGRDYDEIEKTILFHFDTGPNGENAHAMVEQLGKYAELGFSVAHGSVANVCSITPLDLIGSQILPEIADL
jgi:F420-dependent oxidoreductase-like protein